MQAVTDDLHLRRKLACHVWRKRRRKKKKRTLNPSCWSVERSRRLLTPSVNNLQAPPCFREPAVGTAGLAVAAGIAAKGGASVSYVCCFPQSSGARRPPVHSQRELKSKNVGTEFRENSSETIGCSDWSLMRSTKKKKKNPQIPLATPSRNSRPELKLQFHLKKKKKKKTLANANCS